MTEANTLYVIYAVPVNESRGIYLIKSEDQGQSWVSVNKVYDAAGEGAQAVDHPDLVVDPDGMLHAAWVETDRVGSGMPRGIYYSQSMDGGQTWSEPKQIFDAVAAGWAMVDRPHLAITDNGQMHVLWTRYSLPSGEGPLALLYTHSDDGGTTWSAPQMVVEKSVGWSQIAQIDAAIELVRGAGTEFIIHFQEVEYEPRT